MRPEKVTIVEDLQARLNASPFLFVADYTGLRVDQFSELRKRLSGAGAECKVVKNTFLRRAAKQAGMPELLELKGQTAIIVGEKDVAAAAKIVKSFAAEFQKPVLKGGVIDNTVVTTDQIKAIADLPAREVLLAQLLGVLLAPATKLVRVLNEPATSLARLLKAKAEKDGEGQAPAAEILEAEAVAPSEEAPAAAAEAVTPVSEVTAPVADTPAPVADTPAPVAE